MKDYKFNITGEYTRLSEALSVFLEGAGSKLTEDEFFTVGEVIWTNTGEETPDTQTAQVLVSFDNNLTEDRLDAFKSEFSDLEIVLSGVA